MNMDFLPIDTPRFLASRAALLVALALLCLLAAHAHAAENGTREVWLLDRGDSIEQPGGNVQEVAAFLDADISRADLHTRVIRLQRQALASSELETHFQKNPPPQKVNAIIWLDWNPPSEDQQDSIILISIYFPESGRRVLRSLASRKNQAVATAPLVSLLAEELIPPESRDRSNATDIAPEVIETQADALAVPEPKKLAVSLLGAVLTHPQQEIVLGGATVELTYFPFPPVALGFGVGALSTAAPKQDRFKIHYREVPIWVGGHYIALLNGHEIQVNLSMLADVTLITFTDRYKWIEQKRYERVNVGLVGGLGYSYYFHKILGFQAQFNVSYTPQIQRYQIDGKTVFTQPSYALWAMAGFTFDFFHR